MATLEQLHSALIQADKAGNVEDATALANEIRSMRAQPATKPETSFLKDAASFAGNTLAGLGRGAGSIGATLLTPYDKMAGNTKSWGNPERRNAMDVGLSDMGADTSSLAYQGGKIAGEIAGTAGAGGGIARVLGASPKIAAAAPNLLKAIASNGMTAGTAGIGTRIAGGAIAGAGSGALINPEEDALKGAVVGGAFPALVKVAGAAGNIAGSLVKPFTIGGQNKLAMNTFNEFASNSENALKNIAAAKQYVAGSEPTTAMAAGDNGIAALSRALQNANPQYASELAARQTAQNQARTVALEGIAGNTGKISTAEKARDMLTEPMRDSVLKAAGKMPTDEILSKIGSLIDSPNNAGSLSQEALKKFQNSIASASKDGVIDSRALYEIRKDINTVLNGKLQGDAGNLRYASGQLKNVKGIIDDAIDLYSRKVKTSDLSSASRDVALPSSNVGAYLGDMGNKAPRTTWKDYLNTYAKESIPINQMEKLEQIMKSIQTGTVDSSGGLIISGAKLNNILKNEGSDLAKSLSPKQLEILRNVSADLNASQISATTGRAVGSNTLQNIAQNNVLNNTFGKSLGGSTTATSTLNAVLKYPYAEANKQIQEKLANMMLDPKYAAKIAQDAEANLLVKALLKKSQKPLNFAAKTAPLIGNGGD